MRCANPTLLVLLAATALAGAAPCAQAQYVDGLYVSGGLGLNVLQDQDISRNAAAGGGSGRARYDLGVAGVVALGYGYGNGIRAELELNARTNDVERFGGFGGLGGAGAGRVRQYGGMLNAWWDYDLGWNVGVPLIPTIGAGIGYGVAEADNVRGGSLARIDDSRGNFAYQLMTGLLLPLDAAGHFAASLEYRFYSILGDDFAVKGTTGKAELDDFRNHSVMIGLRYSFNPTLVAAAPAPVATAPAPARTYLVFFDFAQAALTDRARFVVAEAASAARTTGSARIEIAGHTDTVGSAQFNQGLSMRRAEAVAIELEARGIPRAGMVLQAFGFTRLLVPTGPGVREPQNRRVEIVLR
jgi:opacity protein-like surface antigen